MKYAITLWCMCTYIYSNSWREVTTVKWCCQDCTQSVRRSTEVEGGCLNYNTNMNLRDSQRQAYSNDDNMQTLLSILHYERNLYTSPQKDHKPNDKFRELIWKSLTFCRCVKACWERNTCLLRHLLTCLLCQSRWLCYVSSSLPQWRVCWKGILVDFFSILQSENRSCL